MKTAMYPGIQIPGSNSTDHEEAKRHLKILNLKRLLLFSFIKDPAKYNSSECSN